MGFESGQIMTGDECVIVPKALRARGFLARSLGLLGQPEPAMDAALWLDRCAAVHCFGMRHAIDVVHLDRGGRVLVINRQVRPWRWSAVYGGYSVIELGHGNAAFLGLEAGMTLRFEAAACDTGITCTAGKAC